MTLICWFYDLGKIVREAVRFFLWSSAAMAIFAFYMACTAGYGIRERYFVHLVAFFWICTFFLIEEYARKRTEATALSAPPTPLAFALCAALVAIGLAQVNVTKFTKNLYAEGFPCGFLQPDF